MTDGKGKPAESPGSRIIAEIGTGQAAKKHALSLHISQDIRKTIGKMCDLERPISTTDHEQLLLR